EQLRRLRELEAWCAEHDGRELGLGWRKVRRDRGDPDEKIALTLLQHAIDGPAIGIIVWRAGRVTHPERIAADPGAYGCGGDGALAAAKREPGEARGLIEILRESGELLDGKLGKGKIERRRRPDHDAVFRLLALLGKSVDLGERHALDLHRLQSEAAQPRAQHAGDLAGLLRLAGERDDV